MFESDKDSTSQEQCQINLNTIKSKFILSIKNHPWLPYCRRTIYVRFLLKDSTEYNRLLDSTNLMLFCYPPDRELTDKKVYRTI